MDLRRNASKIYLNDRRFRVSVCGRRFGKTWLMGLELIRAAQKANSTSWYISPSYRQSKQVMWSVLKGMIPAEYLEKINETDLSIILVNGSTIALRGADNPDSLRGIGLDFAAFDEYDFMKPNVWPEIIRPMFATTGGKAIFCGTPDGFSSLYDLYSRGKSELEEDKDWASFQFTTLDGGWVPADEIESARRDMDEKTFRQEYEASFENAAGRVYYAFSKGNVREPPPTAGHCQLSMGCDFNVSPMTAVIFFEGNNETHVIDEIVIPQNSNTMELVIEARNRYKTRIVNVYPDPAGAARKTSAEIGRSDHEILRQAGFTVLSRAATLSVRDGINAVNSRLCSASGERKLFISPKCKNLIRALECHSFKPGTSLPNQDGHEHILDSLRYPTEYLHPIRERQEWTRG